MTKLLTVVVALALLAALGATAPLPDAVAQAPAIEQINDRLGVGVNLGNALESRREGDWGMTLQADFFDEIAAAGFRHVRVPIQFSGYTGGAPDFLIPDGIDPTVPNADNLWERIDWVIANAERNGLYVILDLHHFGELFEDVAGERARFLAIWEQISERYANASSLVLFELLNEPHGQFSADPSLLNDLLADGLAVVRATNPTRPVLVGPVNWNSIASLESLQLPNDPNLIVSVHFYDPFPFTHQGAEWTSPTLPAPVAFEGTLVDFGAGWGDWSWNTSAVPTANSLAVTFDGQWSGLGFGQNTPFDPDTLEVVVSGQGEISVRCADASGDTEVDRLTSTGAASTFTVDMATCPSSTQAINFIMASATFDSVLNFSQIELCDASGSCRRLIESGNQAIESAFDRAAAWGQANGRPINVGEFGAYSAQGVADLAERAEWTETVRTAGRSRGFSMSYWEFGAGFGVYNRTTGTWVAPLLDALGVEATNPPTQPAQCNGKDATIMWSATAVATSGDDVIVGTSGADVINALGGDDTVCAGAGADVVTAGAGDDLVWGGPGADVINGGAGFDDLSGQDGDDTIRGGDAADTIDGGPGSDRIWGENGWDRISGSSGADEIYGGQGNDWIWAGADADMLDGGSGNDLLLGFDGDDTIAAGGGNDKMNGMNGDDTITGGAGGDQIWGGLGNDTIDAGAGFDWVWGFWGEDVIYGGHGDDSLYGEGNNDSLSGGPGNDLLDGDYGDDSIVGGAGNDTLRGGQRNDTLTGGPGNDLIDGGFGIDYCDGNGGIDTATSCETKRNAQ